MDTPNKSFKKMNKHKYQDTTKKVMSLHTPKSLLILPKVLDKDNTSSVLARSHTKLQINSSL